MTLWEIKQARRWGTDKSREYLDTYERFFAPIREQWLTLLEIGVKHGASLLLWRDYFLKAKIVGVDIDISRATSGLGVLNVVGTPAIRLHQADQANRAELALIALMEAPDGFDIIIDDGSHLAKDAAASFEALFDKHLKPGGLYCIEDWGVGYRGNWPDGVEPLPPQTPTELAGTPTWYPSHDAGMVGWVKQLIDEMCLKRAIESIHLQHGLAILRKRVA